MDLRPRHLALPALVGGFLLAGCHDGDSPTRVRSLSPPDPSLQHEEGHCVVTSAENAGTGSLREAVADETCTTITFDASLEGETITLGSPLDPIDLEGTRDLRIVGPGADLLTVRSDPDDPSSIFGILREGSELEISGLTLAEADRAIINDLGTLTVSEMVFRDNIASDRGGAAILNGTGATTSVHASTFENNRVTTFQHDAGGGAIRNEGGTLNVTASTFVGNRTTLLSTQGGGAIRHAGQVGTGTTRITASTFTENLSPHGGAVASNGGQVIIVASTISGNWVFEVEPLGGPQLEALNATIQLRSTIVTDPRPNTGGINCFESEPNEISSAHYNLSDDETCNLVGDGDQQGSGFTADLGPLQDNGGPTHTMLPGEDSDALEVIPGDICSALPISSETDQRGVERPQGEACEVGAVEIEVHDDPPPAPVEITEVTNSGPVEEGEAALIAVSATGPEGAPLTYGFDCDDDGTFEISQVDDATAECTFAEAGNHPVSVRVTDGQTAADAQTTVEVLEPTHDFGGFEGPVDGPPAWNVARAGQVVPVRFSLGGSQGMDILAEGSPSSREIDCQDAADDDGDLVSIDSPGKSGLDYDDTTDEYQLNWKTDRRWSGTCRELIVELDDGSAHTALFRFR